MTADKERQEKLRKFDEFIRLTAPLAGAALADMVIQERRAKQQLSKQKPLSRAV